MYMFHHDDVVNDPRVMQLLNILYSADMDAVSPIKEFSSWFFRAIELVEVNTDWSIDKSACLLNNDFFRVDIKLDAMGEKQYFVTTHMQPVNTNLNKLLKIGLKIEKLFNLTFSNGKTLKPNSALICSVYHDIVKATRLYLGFCDPV